MCKISGAFASHLCVRHARGHIACAGIGLSQAHIERRSRWRSESLKTRSDLNPPRCVRHVCDVWKNPHLASLAHTFLKSSTHKPEVLNCHIEIS